MTQDTSRATASLSQVPTRTYALDLYTLPGYRHLYERNPHLPLQIHRLYLRRLRLHPSGRLHLRSPRLHMQRLSTFSQGPDTMSGPWLISWTPRATKPPLSIYTALLAEPKYPASRTFTGRARSAQGHQKHHRWSVNKAAPTADSRRDVRLAEGSVD